MQHTRVPPQLRAVTFDFIEDQNFLILHFFYDGKITDKLFDLASCACVEVDLGKSNFYTINEDRVCCITPLCLEEQE